jgi:hypothetical protein
VVSAAAINLASQPSRFHTVGMDDDFVSKAG